MKYFFILGRNPQLSLAELMSYFEKENVVFQSSSVRENAILIETEQKLNLDKMIKELGGTIAIGEASVTGRKQDITNFIDKNEIYYGEELKFTYSVMDFADEETFDEILQMIKDKFKEERLKAFYRSTMGILDIQEKGYTSGTPSKIKSKDVVYFLLKGTDYCFGELKAVFDSKETEKRDIEKPMRREELAISPRLAKILINLAQLKKGDTMIDPFCGIGTVVMEAMVQDINAIGIDTDFPAIKGAEKNINWLKSKYKINANYELINDDSRKRRVRFADGIATEPSLGELLKITPTEEKARQMIENFENLMIDVLNNLKTALKPGQKIAFTAPLIRTHSRKMGCNTNRICNNTNMKLSTIKTIKNISFPIAEMRKDSIVGREFYVLVR